MPTVANPPRIDEQAGRQQREHAAEASPDRRNHFHNLPCSHSEYWPDTERCTGLAAAATLRVALRW
jgi:hypothetical protein